MTQIEAAIAAYVSFMWGLPLVILLVGGGFFFMPKKKRTKLTLKSNEIG